MGLSFLAQLSFRDGDGDIDDDGDDDDVDNASRNTMYCYAPFRVTAGSNPDVASLSSANFYRCPNTHA